MSETDEWFYPTTFKFDVHSFVKQKEDTDLEMRASEPAPRIHGLVIRQGQRSKKNKKNEAIFDCNSYQVVDDVGKLHYFLEGDLE